MVSIPSLWLPILVSAVLVFIVSSIIHMFLPYHRNDFAKVPSENDVMDALRKFDIPCMAACDTNGDGLVEGQVSDVVHMLMYNFLGGPPPVAPFPDCGLLQNLRDVELGCELASPVCR